MHWSAGPVCTYAYAVNAASAARIVARADVGVEAFDIWLHLRCKTGALRCLTANPELFHHHEMGGARDSLINGRSADVSDSDLVERTENIWHSARCNSRRRARTLVECMGNVE